MLRSALSRALAAAALAALLLTPLAVQARGGMGFHMHGGMGMHLGRFAAGRHGNDSYIKAASDERDKLLSKLKSICRGC
ncbi:hypothetical protein [Rhodopseudomonas telluris]|uniref:Uncharacterized protein n=1 Tax=Rhodopseudomonas telluris TaxID=644215 RepID=A0ABV6EWH8_9BRAD